MGVPGEQTGSARITCDPFLWVRIPPPALDKYVRFFVHFFVQRGTINKWTVAVHRNPKPGDVKWQL